MEITTTKNRWPLNKYTLIDNYLSSAAISRGSAAVEWTIVIVLFECTVLQWTIVPVELSVLFVDVQIRSLPTKAKLVILPFLSVTNFSTLEPSTLARKTVFLERHNNFHNDRSPIYLYLTNIYWIFLLKVYVLTQYQIIKYHKWYFCKCLYICIRIERVIYSLPL